MSAQAGQPTFVLGVGAMKAGTTWLHDYLASSPQCAPGHRKEFHVLDSIDLPSERWMRARIAKRAQKAGQAAVDERAVDAGSLLQASMVWDESLYPAYFAGLVSGALPDGRARFTMDLTPAHAMLPARRLAWVRDSFAARGVRTAAVFLVRDPVDRIWSHVRMVQSRQPDQLPRSSEEHLLELHAHPTYASRTRYEHTLAALAETFDPSDVHLGVYERLFTEESVAALCDVVGIDRHPARFDVRANASPPAEQGLSEDTERRVAEHFAETYTAVAAALPALDLRSAWPSSRWVL